MKPITINSKTGVNLVLMILASILLSSCVAREKIAYFQTDLQAIEELADRYEARIQPDDILAITVFARNEEATKIFNQEANSSGSGGGNSGDRRKTYLVDEDGYIEFPVLGRIKLAGMTRLEAISYLKGMLSREIIDPGVALYIKNFKFTILGEVSKPGTYTVDNERITILQALGLAGDLSINGERDNVLLIREEDGSRNFHRIDLTTDEIFNNEIYYLSQNDIIYVEPNQRARNQSSPLRGDISFLMSITSFIITLYLFFTRI